MNKDNYHEQGNIIIMLLLLPLGHISNSLPLGGFQTLIKATTISTQASKRYNTNKLLEICPRGNNKMVIIIFPCS